MDGQPKSTGVDSLRERLDVNFALKAAGLGVWELDPTTNLVNWDERCRELFGLAKDNRLPYEQAIRHIHPDDVVGVDKAVQWAMNPQSDGVYDRTYRTVGADDGLLRWVRFIGRGYFTKLGEVYRFAGIAQDVTKDIETQQIRASEARFRSLIEEAPVAIAIFRGPDHVIELANEAHLKIWGRRADEVVGKPLFEALPESKGIGYEELLTNVLTTGEPFHAHELSAPLVRNGQLETVYFSFVYQPLRDTDGTITGVTVVANEITEQVVARQRIEESEERYRTLAAELEQQVQQRTEELVALNEELSATNEELTASNEELQNSNEGTVAVNEKLNESNYNLGRSNESLEKFAYVASHDLQEPLRKIQQFGDILKTQHADQLGAGVMYLERMQSAAGRMSSLIRDLLSFSRIATQQETVSSVPLHDIVDTVLGDLELRIQEAGAFVDVGALPVVQGDRSQLEQLFQNLLNNALKFRRAGVPPVIRVGYRMVFNHELPSSVKPTRLVRLYYCVEVSDNGVGFDEKYLDRIFQVFQRLHGKNEFAGTGIGLAICEKVVANHGGAITAISEPDQGATFSVYLPR